MKEYKLEVRTPAANYQSLTPAMALSQIVDHLRMCALIYAPTEHLGDYVVYIDRGELESAEDECLYRRECDTFERILTDAAAYHILSMAVAEKGFGSDKVFKLGQYRYRMREVERDAFGGASADSVEVDEYAGMSEEARRSFAELREREFVTNFLANPTGDGAKPSAKSHEPKSLAADVERYRERQQQRKRGEL